MKEQILTRSQTYAFTSAITKTMLSLTEVCLLNDTSLKRHFEEKNNFTGHSVNFSFLFYDLKLIKYLSARNLYLVTSVVFFLAVW